MTSIDKLIEDSMVLFDAVQAAGNEAGNFNQEHQITDNISSIYELYEHGPEHIYAAPYYPREEEYGKRVDSVSGDVYRRIVIKYRGEVVFALEGRDSLQMSYSTEDRTWEKELVDWYQTDKGTHCK